MNLINLKSAGVLMAIGFLIALLDSVTVGCGNILNIFRGCGGASNWDDLTWGWFGVILLAIGVIVFILSYFKPGK